MMNSRNAFLLITLFVLGHLATAQDDFMAEYQKGLESLETGDYQKAITYLENAISIQPESSASVRTYGVQFKPYHPYTALTEAYLWSDIPESYEMAKRYIDLAFENGEDNIRKFPDLKNKPHSLKRVIESLLSQKQLDSKPKLPLDTVSALIKDGKFSEALEQVRLLDHSFPNEPVLEIWKAILEEIEDKTQTVEQSEVDRQENLERYLTSARTFVGEDDPQKAYQAYLFVRELDPGNKEAEQFVENYTKQLKQQGKTQEEITLELETYMTQNQDLLAQLVNQRQKNRRIQSEIATLKNQIKLLEKRDLDPKPGIEVNWDLVPIAEDEKIFNISATVQSQTPLTTLNLFINGARVRQWGLNGAKKFRIPTLANYAFLNYENGLRIEGLDSLGNTVSNSMTYNIPKRKNRFILALPKLFLFFSLFAISYYYISTQRKKRLAFRERFNPYIAGAPVFTDQMFFGRNELVKQIINTLHNNSMMICGERRIGKTSFLHRLYALLPKIEDPEYRFFPIMIDLQGVEESQFFAYLDHEIRETLSEAGIQLEPRTDQTMDVRGFTRSLREILAVLKSNDSLSPKLVLLLDEVDIMNRFSERTNQQLRSVFMKGFAKHLVAVMAGINIKQRWDSEGSPWYNFFEQIQLEPFTARHARALIELPVKGIYYYSEEAVQRILDLAELKPYMIQRICVNLIAHMLTENKRKITKADVDLIFQSLKKERQE